MDIFLLIIGSILIITGVVGCILPVIPGPPISYVGLLLLHFTSKVDLTSFTLVYIGILVVVVTILDYIIPLFGTKLSGGSKWGMRGAAIGVIIGLFFGIIGIFIFPFFGALLGELLYQYNYNKFPSGRKKFSTSLKSAFGSFLGLMFGTILKLSISCFTLFLFVKEAIMGFA